MKDRTFTRGTGCWNCIHANNPTHARDFWKERRQRELQAALTIAMSSPFGEHHPKVVNIRRMVDTADHGVAANQLVRCTTGRLPGGDPVGDLTAHNYMCDRWTGRDGSSMAKVDGKVDLLPEELRERVDGPDPIPFETYKKTLGDDN